MFDIREFDIRFGALRLMRTQHDATWNEIAMLGAPHCGQFLTMPKNAPPEYREIIDDTMLASAAVLKAGMMTLRTNPSQPWFRLKTPDDSVNKRNSAKRWFHRVREIMRAVHDKSNAYGMLGRVYDECPMFGTAASIITDRFDTVQHHTPLTIGEYFIGLNEYDEPDTLVREFTMKVANIVREFGMAACSNEVQAAYRAGHYYQDVTIRHVIEPRSWSERSGVPGPKGMAFRSVYYERNESKEILRESGFRTFPAIVARWQAMSGQAWGTAYPGLMALGAARRLQIEQYRKAEGIDYQTKPPVQVPNSLRDRDQDLLPGGIVPYDQTTPQGGVRTAFEVPIRLDHLLNDIEDVRRSIRQTFHVPMIQTLSSLNDSTQRTAFEIARRSDEAAVVLGPVTLQLQKDLDRPLIASTFDALVRNNLLPPVPEELQGLPLEIEFVGPLAQALKMVEATQIDRFTAQLGLIAQIKPDVTDKLNADEWADVYSDMFGVHPDLIEANENVAVIRQARAQAQQAQAQAEVAEQAGRTMRDLSLAQTDRPSVLTQGGA